MKIQAIWKKYENCIIMVLTILVNAVIMSVCFDFFYDLNDDVMMKDIMAGVYTGTPDGHNMQTLYILGAFISLCYRLCRNFPWYGLFLCLCQFGSLYLAGVRLLRVCTGRLAKAGCVLVTTVFLWGVLLSHMVSLQYTVTCAMLVAAAIFLFMTTERGLTPKAFVWQNVPSMLLVVLAYQIRTEMLLLVFPLIGLAGLFRMAEEEKFFRKENYIKYGFVLGGILAGMLFSRAVDFAAYGSVEWKTFLTFFEKRTEVYDFHYDILTSGDHREYLASIGLSDAEQQLLANYNFGLDEKIDEEVLCRIADYAASADEDGQDMAASADHGTKESLTGLFGQLLQLGKLSWYRALHKGDLPYNLPVVFGYLCVAVFGVLAAVADKTRSGCQKWGFLWKLGLLCIVRTCLWMYILMRGRDPERIIHSLYLAELALLMGMLMMRSRQTESGKLPEGRILQEFLHRKMVVVWILLGTFCLWNLPHSIRSVSENQRAREEANQGCKAIDEYCKANPDNFYFEDVYSTVGFSQEIFRDVDNSMANYDIMGGWMCKSPLYREKLKQFGMETMEEGLLYDDSVFFVMEMGTADSSTEWMEDYYAEKGIDAMIEQIDIVGQKYAVYRVYAKTAEGKE